MASPLKRAVHSSSPGFGMNGGVHALLEAAKNTAIPYPGQVTDWGEAKLGAGGRERKRRDVRRRSASAARGRGRALPGGARQRAPGEPAQGSRLGERMLAEARGSHGRALRGR